MIDLQKKEITELEKKIEVINDDNIRIFKDIQLSLEANFKRIEKLEAKLDIFDVSGMVNIEEELSELKEKQNHWATLENVTVCRLGIENLEDVLREVLLSVELKGITDVDKGRGRLELLGMLGGEKPVVGESRVATLSSSDKPTDTGSITPSKRDPFEVIVPKDYWESAREDLIQDTLDDLKEFELKRYSDMIRTLTKLREKLEGKLHDT